ncbi:MAG: hypothetical protein MI922_29980, partial [Bacteroidales bacterium]|nr:hypothetical protein [Bacteroidales bacterium]
ILNYQLKNSNSEIDSFAYKLSDGKRISEKAYCVVNIRKPASIKFSGDNYTGSIKNYTFLNANRWDVLKDGSDYRLCMTTTDFGAQQGARPGEYAIINKRNYAGDFKMSLKVKSVEDFTVQNNIDFELIFGYQDNENFNYVFMFYNPVNKNNNCEIHIVRNGRTAERVSVGNVEIYKESKYYNFGIERKGNNVKVFIDGNKIADATDDNLKRSGQLGFGSRNEQFYFDDVKVSGKYD